jgi:hypothetical protein
MKGNVIDTLELQPLQDVHRGRCAQTSNSSATTDDTVVTRVQCESTVHLTMDPDKALELDIRSHNEWSWNEFWYPPSIPNELQLWRKENMAIPMCYLMVGTMQGLVRPLLNVYPLDLNATEAQQTTLATVATLPAALKLLYGFLSDNVPLCGYRRKPYMALGWLSASLTMMILGYSSNLSILYADDNQPIAPGGAPSISFLTGAFFVFGTGMWLADVMADSLVAQKARLESESMRGSMQSSCYVARFLGLLLAAPISTLLYSRHGASRIVLMLTIIPIAMAPLVYCLREDRNGPIPSTRDQCSELWKTACSRSVWQPMAFVYVFNVLQVSNAAWRQYLKSVLHFTSAEMNSLLIASYVLLYVGTLTYKCCFLHASWQRIYQVCIALNALFSGLQLLLIRNVTFGLSPFVFALGDDAFSEFLEGVQFLPVAILMVALCPPGSEGASYAMFTTVWYGHCVCVYVCITLDIPIG